MHPMDGRAIMRQAMTYLDSILSRVTKPARYSGGEWNTIVKDWDRVDVKVALAYPDLYEVGMSNLGLAILYDILNSEPHILAERVYAPWIDMESEMRANGIPLFSLESKRPLREFDIIGFSLGYELTYTNVLNMLDLAGIPVAASERGDSYPLIIAGGSCALNPEPMADFIDLFVLGEGEEVLLELIELLRMWKREGGGRQELLRKAALMPGIYVPSLYRVDYRDDYTLAAVVPLVPEASPTIKRRTLSKLPPPLTGPIVPYIEVIHDRGVAEIQRGCTRACRFCQAGIIYRPLRQRPKDEVLRAVDEILRNCGYSEVSLLSLSASDYEGIEELVQTLIQRYKSDNITFSLPSLRIEELSLRLMELTHPRKKSGLTFAPESGSERLRRAINKSIPEEELLRTMEFAFKRGWMSPKLYFMIGLPTETSEDVDSITELIRKTNLLGKEVAGRQPQLKVSVSAFVPKAHTPFQWVAQNSEEELSAKLDSLRHSLRKRAQFSWQDPRMSLLEGVLARGDRRLGGGIRRAWELGAGFDAWSEHFNYQRWLMAFEESRLDPGFYANRVRPLDEVLPWSHIDIGVSQSYLKREYLRTMKEQETGDCRVGKCNACGMERWDPECERRYKELLPKTKNVNEY